MLTRNSPAPKTCRSQAETTLTVHQRCRAGTSVVTLQQLAMRAMQVLHCLCVYGCQRADLGSRQVVERRLDEVREVIRQVPVARSLRK